MSRWWLLVFVLVAFLITPFVIWGEAFEGGDVGQWLAMYGKWAWAVGIGLLCADILLPIPGTLVMSALGFLYGWLLGGCIAAAGSCLAGLVAYWGSRWGGRGAAVWIAGEDSLAKAERWFAGASAGWLVALSRWTPVLPEAVACLAGLARMPVKRFVVSLVCGSVPLGFAFAAIGELGTHHAGAALTLSAVLPLFLYGVAAWRLRTKS
ncbi:MAG: VTT domain-containing protein [Verrucomicrobiaceae bacterium]|nr:VTT domain-containing protein [Verrucomicrobiaceae bacterium]